MANWSDPRPGVAPFRAATGTRDVAYDAGLRSFMLSVYNLMASGVLLTGVLALGFAYSGAWRVLVSGNHLSPLGWIVALAPLGLALIVNFGGRNMSNGALQAIFWAFAATFGVSLSTIFIAYTSTSIAGAFFATAAGFAGLSLYGYTTERDLSAVASFLIVGLVGIIVASLFNLWLGSGPLNLVIAIAGVLVFAGLTAWHTQRTKGMYAYVAGTADEGRARTMSALSLYLDFINMFMFILQLFGGRRS